MTGRKCGAYTRRQCSGCGEIKQPEAFHTNIVRGVRYLRSECRVCANVKRLAKAASRPGHRLQRPLGSTVEEYIQHRIVKEDRGHSSPCWIWQLGTTPKGYARRKLPGTDRMVFIHRVSFELKHGPIPDELVIDHLCKQKACVNPDHLEPVTIGENLRRHWRETEAV